MRTRLALLLVVIVALVAGASSLMTSHFGMREWPVAPPPDTATRLITPSEAAGRVTDRAANDRDEPAERAQRDDADRASGNGDPAPRTTPVEDARRHERRPATRTTDDADRDAPHAGTAPETPSQTDEPTADAETQPVPAPPAAPADTKQHSRDDDVVPETPQAAAPEPDLATGGSIQAPSDGGRRSPLRDLLDPLL